MPHEGRTAYHNGVPAAPRKPPTTPANGTRAARLPEFSLADSGIAKRFPRDHEGVIA